LTRDDDSGRYLAGVSIRSGRGSATHDRIVRFAPTFDSRELAARFATDQAMAWLRANTCALAP